MKKYITPSNIIFVIAIGLLLYKPSKIWLIRQLSFSPSIEKISDTQKIQNYNWYLKGLNTPDIDFQSLKGTVVFVNYWATWCPPCIAELPMIQQFYNEYKDKIAFVFITNEKQEVVVEFLQKNNYKLPVYNMASNPPELLNQSNSIPATYIIDKKGYIRLFKTGAANWDSKKFKDEIETVLNN